MGRENRPGLLPNQTLNDRRNQPIEFLSWVEEDAIEPSGFLPSSFYQLLQTFHAITRMYVPMADPLHELEAFMGACLKPGMIQVSVPKVYLRCSDQTALYVCFDWLAWIQSTDYVQIGEDQ